MGYKGSKCNPKLVLLWVCDHADPIWNLVKEIWSQILPRSWNVDQFCVWAVGANSCAQRLPLALCSPIHTRPWGGELPYSAANV